MAYPTTLDSLPENSTNATPMVDTHPELHNDANAAINALQEKVGIDSSADDTTIDYKLSGVATGDKAASVTGTETLTNKRLTSPKINENVALTATATELNLLDGITALDTDLSSVSSNDDTIPTAKAVSAVVGRLLKVTLLTSTSSSTFTTQALTKQIVAHLVGGGGGGGGAINSSGSQVSTGSGGGAGGYGIIQVAVSSSTGYTYQCGAAGSTGSGAAGGNGGNTTLVIGATTYTAYGGSGGNRSASSTSAGSLLGGIGGNASTNCTVNGAGPNGGDSIRFSGSVGFFGAGGSSVYGRGGWSGNTDASGNAAVGYGSGGSGSMSINASGAKTGGAATAGCILVYEYT